MRPTSSPALVFDSPVGAIVITGEAIDGRITSIWVQLNPDKTPPSNIRRASSDPPDARGRVYSEGTRRG